MSGSSSIVMATNATLVCDIPFKPGSITFVTNSAEITISGPGTISGGAALEVAASGTATLRGGLTLASGASLAFNFTAKEVAPTLTVPSVAFYAGTATNIVVKISAADGIVGSAHTLTSSGGAFRGVTVSLDETSRPYWVKSVSVENGEIVMSVRSAGVIYVE